MIIEIESNISAPVLNIEFNLLKLVAKKRKYANFPCNPSI